VEYETCAPSEEGGVGEAPGFVLAVLSMGAAEVTGYVCVTAPTLHIVGVAPPFKLNPLCHCFVSGDPPPGVKVLSQLKKKLRDFHL